MTLANIIVIFVFTYYSLYLIRLLFSKKHRFAIKTVNSQLEKLRKKAHKTLEEQKAFINLKYPKTGKFKFRWKIIPRLLFDIFLYVLFFRLWLYVFVYFNINVKFWQSILFIIIFPMLFNWLLEKVNLQQNDLRYMLRW